jgi:hypothetical protein
MSAYICNTEYYYFIQTLKRTKHTNLKKYNHQLLYQNVNDFFLFFTASNGQIDCYECTVHPPETYTNKLSKLCTKFNTSDYFKVHCPNSTYCKKKSFQLEVQPGSNYSNK